MPWPALAVLALLAACAVGILIFAAGSTIGRWLDAMESDDQYVKHTYDKPEDHL